jgi:diguanylate cyclase (GGDEF)-like protein
LIVHEASRLEILRACQILDTPAEKAFDDLVRLAAMICEAPMSLIAFVDEDRLWLKAAVGIDERTLPRPRSFCDWAIRSLTFSVVPDVKHDSRFDGHPLVDGGARFYAAAPLVMAARHAIGTLAVLDRQPRALSTGQSEALTILADQVVSRLELRRQAIRDSLTGLLNRRYFEEVLRHEVARAARQGLSVGVLMFDLDNFKTVNNALGHAFGDGMLRRLGRVLRAHLRAEDIACRYGGDEFVLLMPGLTLLEAQARAEELRSLAGRKLAELALASGHPTVVTLSVGVAAYPFNGVDAAALLKSADIALDTAKAHGRDCVSVAAPSSGPLKAAPPIVLLVDDCEHDGSVQYLRDAGMHVELAADGVAAVNKARRRRPDLIIMDLSLPVIDGLAATQQLKAHAQTRNIPVIGLCADRPGGEEEARRAGCDGFIVRPCVPERLLGEIRRFI